MHPVIRINIFLISTYFIVQAKPVQLMLLGFILFWTCLFLPKKIITLMWKMIWRLKWFYISIFILFSFFPPDDINIVSKTTGNLMSDLTPVIYYSLTKIIALMLIVISVIVLIVSIPRQDLIASLVYLSKPLTIFGFSSERFAVRIYLIIEIVEFLPNLVSTKTEPTSNNSKIGKIVFSVHHILNEVYKQAENSECKKIQYDTIKFPDFYQWGYLLIVFGLFYFSDIIFTRMTLS